MTFEDKFTEKQKDMITLSLEYAERLSSDVEKIYLYASHENSSYSFNIFYSINGEVMTMRQLATLNGVRANNDLIFDVLKIGTEDLKEVEKICKKYSRSMPTQIKLIYDNVHNKVHADYSYDLFYSNSDTLTSFDIFNQWYEEVKAEIENR